MTIHEYDIRMVLRKDRQADDESIRSFIYQLLSGPVKSRIRGYLRENIIQINPSFLKPIQIQHNSPYKFEINQANDRHWGNHDSHLANGYMSE